MTPIGIDNVVKLEQRAKHSAPIVVISAGRVTLDRLVHPSNVFAPSASILDGIVMDVRDVHP